MEGRITDCILADIGTLLADQGVTDCTREALIVLAETARKEGLKVIFRAHTSALYAGKNAVNTRDASRAFVEVLESFAPPNSLSFQQCEQAMSRDVNSFGLGSFPKSFEGLPLPANDH